MTIPVDTGCDFGAGTLAERLAARWDERAARVVITVSGDLVMALGLDAANTLAAALDYALAMARAADDPTSRIHDAAAPTDVRCGECDTTTRRLPDGTAPRGWFYRATADAYLCPSCLTALTGRAG